MSLLQPTEIIKFDQEKYEKNLKENEFKNKETNLKEKQGE